MSELLPYEPPTLIESNARRRWVELMKPAAELAKAIAGTDFVKSSIRNNPAAIAACVLYGDEVGLGPLQSLAQISVIDGRPALSAEAMRALILASGHELWIEDSTVSKATVAGRRRDSQQISRVTWTMDDARRAHLAGKQNWRSYPRQMLAARATAELARMIFADAIGGLSIIEELDEGAPDGEGAEQPRGRRRKREDATLTRTSRPQTPAPDEPETPDVPPLPGEPGYSPDAPATETERRRMFAKFREAGIDDRIARLEIVSAVLGRRVTTTSDLSAADVAHVVESLGRAESRSHSEPEPATSDTGDEPGASDEPGDEPDDTPTRITFDVFRARLASEGIDAPLALIEEVGRELFPERGFDDLDANELDSLLDAIRRRHEGRL